MRPPRSHLWCTPWTSRDALGCTTTVWYATALWCTTAFCLHCALCWPCALPLRWWCRQAGEVLLAKGDLSLQGVARVHRRRNGVVPLLHSRVLCGASCVHVCSFRLLLLLLLLGVFVLLL